MRNHLVAANVSLHAIWLLSGLFIGLVHCTMENSGPQDMATGNSGQDKLEYLPSVEKQVVSEHKRPEASNSAEARATFSLHENFNICTEDDALTDGSYQVFSSPHLQIWNEDDDSDTVLGDLEFYAEAENITWVGWEEYADWNSNYANWTFPSEFVNPENEEFATNFGTEYTETVSLNLTINRWMNQTTFNSDGYQLVEFKVNYTDTEFPWSDGDIGAQQHWEVNASIVPGTFQTDAPLESYQEEMHRIHFSQRTEEMQVGVDYNFSVVVKVRLTGNVSPPILYKPNLSVGYPVSEESVLEGEGYTAEMPSEMLPNHVSVAQVSTNTSNLWALERRDQVWGSLGEVSKPVGARAVFSVDDNLGVGTENDILADGNHQLYSSFGVWIHNKDDYTNSVLGDLRYNVMAENITWVGWEDHANWGTTYSNWTFPSPEFVIGENDGFGTDFSITHHEAARVNLTISRWMNQSTFSSNGYQLVKFKLRYTNTEFLWSFGHIGANEHSEVNASLVPGGFKTDAPLEWFNEGVHWIDFGLEKSSIQTAVDYNFSVIVKVEPTAGNTVVYKPQFNIGRGYFHQEVAGPESYTVEMPAAMLPDNVYFAQVSTNTSNLWTFVRNDHVIADLQEIIKVLEQTSIFTSLSPNPATVGRTLTLRGILVDEFSNPLANETIMLYARPLVGSWTYIASLATNEYGTFIWQAVIPGTVTTGTYILATYYPGSEMYKSTYNLAVLVIQ